MLLFVMFMSYVLWFDVLCVLLFFDVLMFVLLSIVIIWFVLCFDRFEYSFFWYLVNSMSSFVSSVCVVWLCYVCVCGVELIVVIVCLF